MTERRSPTDESEVTETDGNPFDAKEPSFGSDATEVAAGLHRRPSATDLPRRLGEVLAGTYRLERVIGVGGMGVVYEASHTRLKLRHAVKLLFPRFASNKDAVKRFRREAEICSELGHPNIVQMVDFNLLKDGSPFIVMELLKGEDLEKRLQRDEKLSVGSTMEIFHQAAGALEAAHRRGVVHRDLKPQNLFLRRVQQGTQVKIVDFGISKIVGSALTALTQTEAICGSPWYMSPEQAKGHSSEVDRRTDVFAMGAIVYHMLSGQPPFGQDSMIPAVLYRVVHEPPKDLLELRPELAPQIAQTVKKALSKEPAHRFQTMEEFDRELITAASHDPKVTLLPELEVGQPVRPPPTGERSVPPAVGPYTTPAGGHLATPWGPSATVNAGFSGFVRQVLPWFLLAMAAVVIGLVLISRRAPEAPAAATAPQATLDTKALLAQATALAQKRQDPQALAMLSKLQLATTDPQQLEAASRLERIIRSRPRIAKARQLIAQQKPAAAIDELNGVLSLVPDHPEAKQLLETAMAGLNKK